jgi:hypothetical protein
MKSLGRVYNIKFFFIEDEDATHFLLLGMKMPPICYIEDKDATHFLY